ncbi:MFS general substrate transporter [Marasmius fiardii PR-910]|nr:MFS general substrate transporter [Marasmius fiardii PR-910]
MAPASTRSSSSRTAENAQHDDLQEMEEKEAHSGEQTKATIVDDWELDPDNPRNWSAWKKWTTVAVVSYYTVVPPLGSSMMAPGLPDIARKYDMRSDTLISLTLSIFLLSFAIGPLFLAPLSEMYGRTWVYHINNIFSIGFNIGCAFSPTANSLIAFRFLFGLTGAAPIAIGGGSIGDLFAPHERASAMAIYSLGPLLGPAIGPIAGGYLAQAVGIKWVFITVACACGLASVIGLPLLRETYAPVIRRRKIKRNLEDPEKVLQTVDPLQNVSKWEYIWVNLSRPVMLLCKSFICFILSLYMAFLYGVYYLMFTTFPALFSNVYGFNTGAGGLAYLGLGVGFFISTVFCARFADRVYEYLSQRNGGKGTPEMRMPVLFVGSLFVPVGLFWYGWSAQAKLHWIMPIIGTAFFAFGMNATYLPVSLYLVDAFTYAASALSAASLFRSLLGFAFPLFASQMFDALGVGGGNSLMGGLAILLGIPFPVWIYYKGESMRARSDLNR